METLDRRQFLVRLFCAGAASGLGPLLHMAEASAATVPVAGPLVLCTLYGGNDGLNMVVPYNNGTYHDWRGDLAIGPDQALPLGTFENVTLGFHPAMTAMQQLFLAGNVAVICGVEYPNPNFSHFQSQTIWQTANLSGEDGTGWLGRWLDAMGADPFRAVSVGATLPPALVGAKQQATAVVDSTSPGAVLPLGGATLTHAYTTLMTPYAGQLPLAAGQALAGRDLLAVGTKTVAALTTEQPPAIAPGRDAGDLGTQLGLAAELITYGFPTSVYSVSQSSYDTHADQANTHAGLLGQLDAAVQSFMSAFPTAAPGKSPVVVIYSEFGRTTKANASAGTDHSTASVVLVVGPAVKGGFYGAMPSFSSLDVYGNLKYTTDFRRVYATLLTEVLGYDSPAGILGGSFASLGFL